MTSLLPSRPSSPSGPPGTDAGPRTPRSLALTSALAGIGAPVVALLLFWAVGLVGWFGSDGGSHGDTRDVLRLAADTWLLGHGAHLTLGPVLVTASPLGVTLLCAVLTYRFGHRAGRTSGVEDLRAAGLATIVLAGVYAVVSMTVALLASTSGVEPGLGLAFLGGALLGALAGGAGLLRGSGLAVELRALLPLHVRSVAYAAAATSVLLVAAGALLAAVGLALHFSAAANVAESLRLDATGGVLSVVLFLALLPNAALLGAAYLLGPGFAVGAGTIVSPAAVTIGPLPAVPVLAALPSDGWAPGWAVLLTLVPLVAAAGSTWWAGRVLPTRSWQVGAARGLGGGVAAAVLLAVALSWAGGSIGPGRMAVTGVGAGTVLASAVTSLGLAGLVGGLLATWWTRRHDVDEPAPVDRVRPARPERPAKPLIPGRPVRRKADGGPETAPDRPDLSSEDTVQVRLDPPR